MWECKYRIKKLISACKLLFQVIRALETTIHDKPKMIYPHMSGLSMGFFYMSIDNKNIYIPKIINIYYQFILNRLKIINNYY